MQATKLEQSFTIMDFVPLAEKYAGDSTLCPLGQSFVAIRRKIKSDNGNEKQVLDYFSKEKLMIFLRSNPSAVKKIKPL